MGEPALQTTQTTSDNPLIDKWYRMNNLYYIIDEDGKSVLFKMRQTQQNLFDNMWHQNNILKSRQQGFTTFIDLFILDEVVFNSNVEAGIVAHRQEDATKIFRRKIKYPYEKLPKWILEERKATTDSKSELILSNNSSVFVSTSMRSGTLQYLHLSEFGYVCNKAPDRAQEIVTGSLEALHDGSILFIESTARGRAGLHYQWCQDDINRQKSGTKLTRLDRKFFFYGWWEDKKNVLFEPVGINSRNRDYFKEKELKLGIKFSEEQKAWYVKKKETLGDLIREEHPTDPEEAFQQSIEGAYFATQMSKVREQRRICKVPVVSGVSVQTAWDLGRNDLMAIWFFQVIGREVHFIDYYENSGEWFEHYAKVMTEKQKEREWHYGKNWAPHDITNHELGNPLSRWEAAASLGLKFEYVPRVQEKMISINAARDLLNISWFDEIHCDVGITRLDNYTKKWNDHLGCYHDTPKKDDNCHGADAFQTVAVAAKSGELYIDNNRVRTFTPRVTRYVY